MKPSNTTAQNSKLVDVSRPDLRAAAPLHSQEFLLVLIACVHLCFLPWALGARDAWAQVLSLALGLVAFFVGLWPRHYRGDLAPQGAFILHPWSRLLKFPVFWFGLLLFAYVTCQGMNSAYIRAAAGPYWWLAPVEHIEWLPSGVNAPFDKMNPWRMLAIWGGAWALVCALWAGLTRRTSIQIILTTVVVNGVLLALLGILQKVTSAKGVFWVITSAPSYFSSTFFYKNYAGAYFNLIFFAAFALMTWHHTRSSRRLARSSPAPVFAFISIIVATAELMSSSRLATALLGTYLMLAIVIFCTKRNCPSTTHPAIIGLCVAAVLAFVSLSAFYLNLGSNLEKFKKLTAQDRQGSIEGRIMARDATIDLVQLNPTYGWGAGCFRHTFPITQRNYPEILKTAEGGAYGWDHAHNDYLELLSELGLVGFSLITLPLIWTVLRCARAVKMHYNAQFYLFLGLLMQLGHSWLDFPLYNCAILVTTTALWSILARWIELESAQ